MEFPPPLPRSPLPFDLTLTAATGADLLGYLRPKIRAAHALLRPPLCELSLALVGDRRMSDLHLQFMNVRGPTDVLTFPLDVDSRGRPVSGEVVVCVPEAVRQVKRRGRDATARPGGRAARRAVAREVLLYALHGLLHLCGFDDKIEVGYRKMHRAEDDILCRLGVGPVFAPPSPPAGVPPSGILPVGVPPAVVPPAARRTRPARRKRPPNPRGRKRPEAR